MVQLKVFSSHELHWYEGKGESILPPESPGFFASGATKREYEVKEREYKFQKEQHKRYKELHDDNIYDLKTIFGKDFTDEEVREITKQLLGIKSADEELHSRTLSAERLANIWLAKVKDKIEVINASISEAIAYNAASGNVYGSHHSLLILVTYRLR